MKLVISLLMFSLSAFAQTYNYQLKGSYKLESSTKKPVEFTLKWAEEKGKITGLYSDNYFIDSAEVAGDHGDLGRNFIVKLPQSKNGVRTITLLTSEVKSPQSGTTVPVSIITRDRRGNPLTNADSASQFLALATVAQRQEEACSEGFGVLEGYCGLYAGMIAEDQDRRNRCNLLYADAVRMELTNDQTLLLHIGVVDDLIETPRHTIGRLPLNPQSNTIDVMSRSCRPLPGVNSSGDTCKQLNLRGEFTTTNDRKHFKGTYTIKEENTNNVCVYTLSLDNQNQ